jgi:BMFP domain-containing protein YqiC
MASALKEKRKTVAEESVKTRKAREKLRKKLEALERKVTPQALEKKTIEIHRWIARHAAHRVVLRSKTISLFDENQNTAKISKKISGLADQIQKEIRQVFDSAHSDRASLALRKMTQGLEK